MAYLSAEFLLGPQLANNLINLGIYDQVREAMFELGLNFDEILRLEPEPGLGSGGLGREIRDGQQVKLTDKWLRSGNPWELPRLDWAVAVKFGGEVQHYRDLKGCHRALWHPAWAVIGTPSISRSWATATTPPIPCACGAPKRPKPSISAH